MRRAMNSKKWKPNSVNTPSASMRGATCHCRLFLITNGHASMLPIISAMPVSKNGGMCLSDTPSAESEAHSAMAASA